MAGWELRGQLRAGADAQLAVDPLEICFHGMDADEQGVGRLSVGAPAATSSATLASVGVRVPTEEAARPPIRASSARVRSAHSAAPSRSKISRACVSVSRASRFLFARRCTVPFTNSVRPSSNGRGRRSC